MRSFLIPLAAMHPRDARRASGRLLVSSYMRHCPACIPTKILHLVERGFTYLPERISGKASKSDNFCPRDFTRRSGGRLAEQKGNLTEANKISVTRDAIYVYTLKIEALFKCEYKIFIGSVSRLSPKDVGRRSPTARSLTFPFLSGRRKIADSNSRNVKTRVLFLFRCPCQKGERRH